MKPSQMATAIAEREGCPCRFVEAIAVLEKLKGCAVWHGIVSVFALDRPTEEICYARFDPDAKAS